MTRAELKRIAEALGISRAAFQRQYRVTWDRKHRAYELPAVDGHGCPLLEGDRCSVHAVRPSQCSAFPFWSELVEDPAAWDRAAEGCEGMDRPGAPLFTLSEMRALARTHRYG